MISPPAPTEDLRRYRMHPVLAQILYQRGYTDPDSARTFLYADDLSAGSFLNIRGKKPNIDRALSRIRVAIRRRERIAIYGDFDADGVTSSVLMAQTLEALGANYEVYIPLRAEEGYGLNSEALRKLARSGVRLVITVDCGVRAVEEVADGNAAGLDIIITDHHSIGPTIPDAYAVINPKLDDCAYTEDMLAGVGVAYRLAEALLTIDANNRRNGKAAPLVAEDLLDLVAIGTVADLAPMNRSENRALVRRGLRRINQAPRLGLAALAEVAGLTIGQIDAMNIGFTLGPRINAAGRLDTAMTAFDLLASRQDAQALELAQELHTLNTQRQELTRAAQDLVRDRLELEAMDNLPLIFASDASFQPGIVGLVAGRLTEEFFRPTVVMEEGDAESRASCRSIPQFDITQALDQCAGLLVRHGGHAQAAGFTVRNENIDALREQLTRIAREALRGQDLQPTLQIDAELPAEQINIELAEALRDLEPTGHLNPSPVLVTRRLQVLEWRTVGRDDQHLKIKFGRQGGPPIDAIAFRMAEWGPHLGAYVDVAYALEINEWNGARTAQLNVRDLQPVEVAAVEDPLERAINERTFNKRAAQARNGR
ncbi:MAG: single-stranded-DNA-specific exonuclease RecJ [Chloroflexi bacterium]|nr:single-stranded-DNA-specific exonuclease RecJ [Chloroflexota bacterium]